MALYCKNFGFQEPFGFGKRFFENPTGPETGPREAGESRKSAPEIFREEVVQKQLNEKNAAAVSAIMAKMEAAKKFEGADGSNAARALLELQKLVTELDAIEKKVEAGQMSPAEGNTAVAQLLEAFADYKIDEREIQALQLMHAQIDQRLELMESLSKPYAPIFLYRGSEEITDEADRSRVKNSEVADEFKVGDTYRVNFGYGFLTREQAEQAENNFRLDEIVVDPKVTEVTVTATDGTKVDLVRKAAPDGSMRFYEKGKSAAKHFPVYNNYIVTVTARSDEAPERREEAPEPPAEREPARTETRRVSFGTETTSRVSEEDPRVVEAQERLSEYERKKLAERQDYIDRAQMELGWGVKKEIPDALRNWTDQDYAQKLYDLDYGEQILGNLKVMAEIAGQPTETMMWGEIRDKTLLASPDVVSYQELTQSVFARTPDGLRDRYQTIKRKLAEGGLKPEKEAKLTVEQKKIEDFFAAAMSFMDVVDKLGVRKHEAAETAAEKPANIEKVEKVLTLLFGEEISSGPLTKPGFFERLFKKAEASPINMQLFGGKVEYRSEMEKYLSEEAAYTYLLHKAITYNPETGEAIITDESLAKFAAYLTELRNKGVVEAMADRDLAEKVKAEKDSYPVITVDNMSDVLTDDTQKELVRRGAAVELSEEYTREKLEEQEYLKEAGSPMEQAQLDQILDLNGPLSLDQLRQVTENLHTLYLGTAGFIFNNVEGEGLKTGFGVDLNIPSAVLLDDGKTQIIVKPHFGAKENVITFDTEIHLGGGVQIKHGRFDIRFQAGGQLGLEQGVSLGAGTQVGVGLDRYNAWTIHTGAEAGLSLAKMASLFSLSVGVDREMSGVLAKKTEKMRGDREVYLKEGMETYNRLLVAQGYSAEEVKAMEQQMNQMLVQQLGDQAMEKLKKVQFLGAGLAYIPPFPPLLPFGLPIPYVKVGFKGKTFMVYNKPKDAPNLDNVAEARLQRQIAAQSGMAGDKTVEWIDVYESGATLYSTSGKKTITAGTRTIEEISRPDYLKGKQDVLAQQGVRLEKTDIGIRLNISKVDGAVDIYTDPKANMETFVGPDGFVYIKMHESDMLSVRRVDQYYPFEHFGNTHRVQLFLSNNIHIANEVIQGESNQHIHYTESFNQRTKAEVVRDQVPGETAHFDATEGGTANLSPEQLVYGQELAARQGIHEDMSHLLEQDHEKMGEVLSTEERQKLYALAEDLLQKDKKNSPPFLEYAKLASTHSFEDVKAFILKNSPKDPSGKAWTNHSLSYMHQSLMMVSLKEHRDKKPEEMAKLILDWNTKRLNEVLVGRGMEKEQAARIAKSLVAYFSRSIVEQLENPDARGLTYINIVEGSIVQIEVGGKTGGYRETFWSSDPNIDKVFAAIPMDETQLSSIFRLEVGDDQAKVDAKAFLATMTERLSPLPVDKPKEFMRSQLGLAVLDSADIIFPVEEGKQLVELFALLSNSNPNQYALREQIPAQYQDIYEKYSSIVLALRERGEWENEGVKLHAKKSQDVGFFDKCMNLTFVMNESLTIEVKVTQEQLKAAQAAGVEVRDYLAGRKGVEFIGVGAAVAYVETEKPPPPEEEEEGEKGPRGLQGTDLRPEAGFNPGGGTDEDAGDAGAEW